MNKHIDMNRTVLTANKAKAIAIVDKLTKIVQNNLGLEFIKVADTFIHSHLTGLTPKEFERQVGEARGICMKYERADVYLTISSLKTYILTYQDLLRRVKKGMSMKEFEDAIHMRITHEDK